MTVTPRTRRLASFLFLAVALIFVGALLRGQWTALDEVLESTRRFDWSFNPWWLTAAVGVGVANLFLMGLVWAGLFRRTGGAARPEEAVRVWVVTNFGRYIPGKVWQLGGLAVYIRAGVTPGRPPSCRPWPSRSSHWSRAQRFRLPR